MNEARGRIVVQLLLHKGIDELTRARLCMQGLSRFQLMWCYRMSSNQDWRLAVLLQWDLSETDGNLNFKLRLEAAD